MLVSASKKNLEGARQPLGAEIRIEVDIEMQQLRGNWVEAMEEERPQPRRQRELRKSGVNIRNVHDISCLEEGGYVLIRGDFVSEHAHQSSSVEACACVIIRRSRSLAVPLDLLLVFAICHSES